MRRPSRALAADIAALLVLAAIGYYLVLVVAA